MAKASDVPLDHAAFKPLPVRQITLEADGEFLAVHVAGRLTADRPPLLCIPGYNRNMSDFTEFVPLLQRLMRTDWPVVLVDLRGRGRSSHRRRADDYTSPNDARDLSIIARALSIDRAIVIGQGHGGQVAMALALERPSLVAAAILLDAGPVTTPQSLVRLRSNVEAIHGPRGGGGLTVMLRRMLAADYPGTDDSELDRLAGRTHVIRPDAPALQLYDPVLIRRLAGFAHDDVLVPQWPFFDLLAGVPLMLLRTELTDQLPREVMDEMMRRRPDALGLAIMRQGSPALLDRTDEVGAIVEFVRRVAHPPERVARRA